MFSFQAHKEQINCIAAQGQKLITSSKDSFTNTFLLTDQFVRVERLKQSLDIIVHVDQQYLYGFEGSNACIYDRQNSVYLAKIDLKSGAFNKPICFEQGKIAYAFGDCMSVNYVRREIGCSEVLSSFHGREILTVCKVGKLLVTGGEDNMLKVSRQGQVL